MTTITIDPAILEAVATDAARRVPHWAKAIARAVVYLQANPCVELLDGGAILYHSSHGGAYPTSPTRCHCAAYAGRRQVPADHACRPRAAARLVQLVTQRQSYVCIYCATVLAPGQTPAGEAILACPRCGHAIHSAVVPPLPCPVRVIPL